MSKRTFWLMVVLWYYCKLIILVFHDAMHMWYQYKGYVMHFLLVCDL